MLKTKFDTYKIKDFVDSIPDLKIPPSKSTRLKQKALSGIGSLSNHRLLPNISNDNLNMELSPSHFQNGNMQRMLTAPATDINRQRIYQSELNMGSRNALKSSMRTQDGISKNFSSKALEATEASTKKQFLDQIRHQEIKQERVKENRDSNFKTALNKFQTNI